MVLSIPGIRILSVDATAAKPRSVRDWARLAEDHELAARSRTAAPEIKTSVIYVLAVRGISCSPVTCE
jgi:hypothetical protein